jgi:2-polyprenyl-3-methyl-5-hydroxy-6-metoxy-1,4-benzoquinol methylase
MIKDNELTSEADWDRNWENFLPSRINPNDQILGENGAFIKTLESNFSLKQGSSTLELGGACSAYLCCLAKFRSMDASIIDYSKIGLGYSDKLFNINNCNLDTHHGDIFDYDFGEKKFDYIVHWGLIEHFKNPIEIFELSHKLLNKSGATFFTMPNMEAIGTSLWRKYDTDDFNTHIFHSDEYIHKLAQDSGFEVHSIYHWGPPILFNAGYWFKEQSLLRPIINFFIRCLSVVSKFLPLYRIGHRKWSAHRAFILVKK